MEHPPPEDDCVFCNLHENVTEYERYVYWHWNGYPVYKIKPLNPVTPGHMLFVPHQHIEGAAASPNLAGHVFAAASHYGSTHDEAFNLITSDGESATQTVMHMHVHYVPRQKGDGLHLPWSP